jgi:hypothetical protein
LSEGSIHQKTSFFDEKKAGRLKISGFSGRRPEREFIFPHKRKRLFPENDGADVHAVGSD